MTNCPSCNAPMGKIHATSCPEREYSPVYLNGNTQKLALAEIVNHHLGYVDSKNPKSFADGMEFQDFVVEQFNKWGFYIQLHASRLYQFSRGESVQRVEIKLDKGCTKYGHLSIEVEERKNVSSSWVKSGIYRDGETIFYIQGNESVLYLFLKRDLVLWHTEREHGRYTEPIPTIRRFFLEFPDADELCIHKITPTDGA